MEWLQTAVTAVYYLFLAWIAAVMVYNLVKTKEWEREVLYVIVLLPFLLRLFRLK
ncbi:MAG: hypothetical protein R6W82_09530 [bacterium]